MDVTREEVLACYRGVIRTLAAGEPLTDAQDFALRIGMLALGATRADVKRDVTAYRSFGGVMRSQSQDWPPLECNLFTRDLLIQLADKHPRLFDSPCSEVRA